MNKPPVVLKALVLLSSLTLGSVFILYKAGVFTWSLVPGVQADENEASQRHSLDERQRQSGLESKLGINGTKEVSSQTHKFYAGSTKSFSANIGSIRKSSIIGSLKAIDKSRTTPKFITSSIAVPQEQHTESTSSLTARSETP